jgi:hypothetical protein
LDRDVISPKNGHIRDDAKPRTGGATDANNFDTEAVIRTSLLRKRIAELIEKGFHRQSTFALSPSGTDSSVTSVAAEMSGGRSLDLHLRQAEDDTTRLVILSKIAHLGRGRRLGSSRR